MLFVVSSRDSFDSGFQQQHNNISSGKKASLKNNRRDESANSGSNKEAFRATGTRFLTHTSVWQIGWHSSGSDCLIRRRDDDDALQ